MLGATETIMPYALTYARIYVLSCVFNVFNVTMNNIVSSEGAAKTTMCALLLGAVLNIGLDPLFIYTLDMGVEGAAIATANANGCNATERLHSLPELFQKTRPAAADCRPLNGRNKVIQN